jgi:hypothetical protein
MKDYFDLYEIKARVVPSIIILLPFIILILMWIGFDKYDATSSVFTGIIGIVTLYACGQLFAKMGRNMQIILFKKWGGTPSIQIIRWKDNTLSNEQKENIINKVKKILEYEMPTLEEEENDPKVADDRRDMIFKDIRSYLYENESKGLWREHLAEYGFARNLIAPSYIAGLLGMISGAAALYKYYESSEAHWVWYGIVCCIWSISFIIGRHTFLLSFTRHMAFRYAESAWLAFLNSGRKKGEK